MQFGYGLGGGATVIESTRRRWLIVLLTFLLGAAMVLVAASPAEAAIAGHNEGTVSEDYVSGCSVDVTFANTNRAGEHHFYEITSWGIREAGGGATLATLPLPQPNLGAGAEVTENASLPAGVYDAEAFAVYSVRHTDMGVLEQSAIPVMSLPPFSVDCADFTGPGFTGEIACEGECVVEVTSGEGQDPEVTVATSQPFKLVITTEEKGPSPGQAFVEITEAGDKDGILPNCGASGDTTNCVQIRRVQGNHTQYCVFFDGDPRFRFR